MKYEYITYENIVIGLSLYLFRKLVSFVYHTVRES